MTFHVVRDGKASERHFEGPQTLTEILTRSERERVTQGSLVPLTESGGLMSLDSPLFPGQTIVLRPPQPERDLAGFGFPINRAGEVVGVSEMLEIRKYEERHGADVYELSLDEIRRRVRGSDPPPSISPGFFGHPPPRSVQELLKALRAKEPVSPGRRKLATLGRKEPVHS